MLERGNDVYEKFGIQLLQPSDLILMQDELLRGDDYAPSRLAGSQIRVEKVRSQQGERLIEKFLSSQVETKGSFNKKLQAVLSNASTIETFVVEDSMGEEHGLIAYSRQFDGQIVVPIFRVGQSKISQYIAKYLVNNLVLKASMENRNIIKIEDTYLPQKILLVLRESGFLKLQNCWAKITLQDVLNAAELREKLSDGIWPDFLNEPMVELVSTLNSSPSQIALQEIERSLWPLKIEEIDTPVFIVPIRPEWAMHLFDVDVASQDLFGSEPSLILNAENVYYRSSTPKVLSAPGRVLWYVSAGNKRYQRLMYIKACSYLDDVEIGKPKQLFSKYKNLGIYKWKDVYNEVAASDLDKDIMAFKFSKTELFKHPIHLSQLQEIWKTDGKTFNNAVAPLLISKEHFFTIYNLGLKGQ